VSLLDHRNGWHRDTASRLLYQRLDPAALAPLAKLARKGKTAQGRLLALYGLRSQRALTASHCMAALDDVSPDVRRHALRLAEPYLDDSPALQALVLSMTGDYSVQVRYQLAFTLGELISTARCEALQRLAIQDGRDPWMRLAIFSSLARDGGAVFEALGADAEFRKSQAGDLFLRQLAEQVGAASHKGEVAGILKAIDRLAPAEKAQAVKWVEALAKKQKGAAKKILLASAGGKAAELLEGLIVDATQVAANDKAAINERVQAIRTLRLATFKRVSVLLERLLQLQQPTPVQAAALDTLSSFPEARVADMTLSAWPGLSPTLRKRAIELLLSRPRWIELFLDAVEANKVGRGELDAARVELLKQHPDREVSLRVTRLFKETALGDRRLVVKRYQAALELKGDPQRGKELFKKTCSACHVLDGVGTAVGADLNGVRNQGAAALLQNVLDPNREVKPKFLNYVLEITDGRVLSGLIRSESANTITLRLADGKELTVQRVEIERMRSTQLSFMPEGVEKQLDLQAMSDLLAYLLKQQ
jgi:putative heme-binding domain-containing protein